jgi:hypothetical protein
MVWLYVQILEALLFNFVGAFTQRKRHLGWWNFSLKIEFPALQEVVAKSKWRLGAVAC